jgi:hypothetical protein
LPVVLLILQYKTEDIENHIKTEFTCRYSNGLLGYESLISITESHQSIAQDLLSKGAFRQTLCVFTTIDFNLEKER